MLHKGLVWEYKKLHGTQHPLRDDSSQPSFESGRNYREIKPGGWTTGLEEDKIARYLNWHTRVFFGLEEDEITWYSNKQNFVRKRNKALEKSKIAWFSDKQGPIFFAYISA